MIRLCKRGRLTLDSRYRETSLRLRILCTFLEFLHCIRLRTTNKGSLLFEP